MLRPRGLRGPGAGAGGRDLVPVGMAGGRPGTSSDVTLLDRQPDVGSPVHYLEVDGGPCEPGMVVAVREPASLPTGGIVDLVVGEQLHLAVPRVLAEHALAGTWHWPDEHPASSPPRPLPAAPRLRRL